MLAVAGGILLALLILGIIRRLPMLLVIAIILYLIGTLCGGS